MTVTLKVQNIVCAFEIFGAVYILRLWLLSALISWEHSERGAGRRDLRWGRASARNNPNSSSYASPPAFVPPIDDCRSLNAASERLEALYEYLMLQSVPNKSSCSSLSAFARLPGALRLFCSERKSTDGYTEECPSWDFTVEGIVRLSCRKSCSAILLLLSLFLVSKVAN